MHRRSVFAVVVALAFSLVGCGTQTVASPAAVRLVDPAPVYLGGVLRNDGTGWAILDDAGHRPTGITGVTQFTNRLEIAHAIGAVKVSTVQVSPDEYYTARDYHVGASVGLAKTVIYIYKGASTTPINPATLDSASGNFWFTLYLYTS